MQMADKIIYKGTYLKALALFTMAQNHYRRCKEFEIELSQLLNYPEEDGSYAGCLSDEIYDPNGKFDVGFRKEGFVVAAEPQEEEAAIVP
jgi:hypothetical protein